MKKLRRTKKFDYKKAKNKKKALKNSNKADIHQQATKDKNVLTNGVFFKKKKSINKCIFIVSTKYMKAFIILSNTTK